MSTFFAKQLKKILICMLIMIISCSIFVINASAEESVIVVEKQLFGASDVSTASKAKSVDFDALKEYLRNEIKKLPDYVDVTAFNIPNTNENIQILTDFIWHECPELFFLDSFGISMSDTIFTRIYVDYEYSLQDCAVMYTDCMEQVDKLVYGVIGNNNLTDVQKALILHDRLAAHCEYDTENYYNNSIPAESYTMYGALVNRFSVCQGYAEAYYYLLEKAGIENRLCPSYDLNHIWNIVTVNGNEYHVDVTWDDPTPDISGSVWHDNFLRSTDGIIATGHRTSDFDKSPSDTTYDNYFWQDFRTEFQVIDNEIYYIDDAASAIKKYSDRSIVTECYDKWVVSTSGAYVIGNYSKLGSDGKNLYYNLSEAVYKYTISTGKTEKIWSPDLSAGEFFRIYGFTYKDGYLICDLNDSPSFSGNDKKTYQQRYLYQDLTSGTPESMSINMLPLKTEYYIGDELNTTGLLLKLTYSNGLVDFISSGFTVNGFSSSSSGTKKVTVSYNGFSETFNVTVRTPSIVLDANSIGIEVYDYCILTATTDPNKVAVEWSSSDEKVATVSDGEIAAKSVGSATVTAEFTYNGYTYKTTCNVTVECKHRSVEILYGTDETCTSSGLTDGKRCYTCGLVIVEQQIIPARGHAPATREEYRMEPTCGEDGSYHLVTYCSWCITILDTEVKTLPATGDHSVETLYGIDATCTLSGLTDGKRCYTCGLVIVEQQIIPARGHTPATREEYRMEPTCGEDGSYNLVTYCTVCNEVIKTETKTIPATGDHVYAIETNRVASTCKTAGYVIAACGCGKTKTTNLALDSNNHENIVILDAVSATCTQSGLTEGKKCSACGTETVAQQTIKAKGHTQAIREENLKEASCSTAGSYNLVTYCTVCNEVIKTETKTIPATGDHVYVTETKRVASTCKTAGYVEMACGCGKTKTTNLALDSNNHENIVILDAVSATCTSNGLTEGKKCSACGTVTVAQQTINAKGHTQATREENRKEASCSTAGSYNLVTYCTVCNEILKTEAKTIPATGDHVYVTETKRVASTCKTAGYVITACGCGKTKTTNLALDSNNHENIVVLDAVSATCTKTGLTDGKQCSVCGVITVTQQTINAKGHTQATREENRKEASCSTAGSYNLITYCTVCNEVIKTETKTIPATGDHVYAIETNRVASTCKTAGYVITACGCGKTKTTNLALDSNNHENIVILDAVSATCTQSGLTEGKKCSACGTETVAQQTINAKGHTQATREENRKEASCSTAGSYNLVTYCTVCNEVIKTETKTITATGDHVYAIETNRVASTCKTAGYVITECGCGKTKTTNLALDSNNHENIVILDAVSATCTQSGLTEGKKCSVCGTITVAQKEIAKTAHREVTVKGKSATCTETGLTDGKKCSVCGTITVAQKEIAKTAHREVTVKGKSATCTETGLTDGKMCSVCGTVTVAQNKVEKKPHSAVIIPGKDPTETETGLTEGEKCSVCGTVIKEQQIIPELNHTHVYTATVTNPTCTEKGYTTYSCKCGDTYLDEYTHEEGHKPEIIAGYDATCTDTGLTDGEKCTVCGEVIVDRKEISAKGHKEEIISGKESTCTDTGLTEGIKCSVCGKILKHQEVVAEKLHNYGDWFVEKPATTESEGLNVRICTHCGDRESEIIPQLPEITDDPVKPEKMLADANGDNKITAADARLILRMAAKLEPSSDEETAYLDINGDKKITAADARIALRISAKIDSIENYKNSKFL